MTVGAIAVTLTAGKSKRVYVKLNPLGRRLLSERHRLPVKLTVSQSTAGDAKTVPTQAITFRN